MNILVFNYSFFTVSETFIYNQVLGLSKKYSVELMAFQFLNEDIFPGNFAKHQLSKSGLLTRMFNAAIRRLVRIDLTLSLPTYLRIKSILSGSKANVIHAHFGQSALTILPFAKSAKVQLVVSFHGQDASAALRVPGYRKQLPELFNYSSAIIISSKHMIDTLELKPWIGKVHLIHYGIDTSMFAPRREIVNSGVLRIIHSGRLVPKKGVPDLIRVFSSISSSFNNVGLEILGDGSEMEFCRKLVADFNLVDKVNFHGSRPNEYVRELISECDIFVLNSRTDDSGDMEGLPVSILEAMSLGMPIISTYHAGIPEAITDGLNGLLIKERSNDELSKALQRLIVDHSLRKYLGENARKTALGSFDRKKMMDNIYSVFDLLDDAARMTSGREP